MNCAVKDNIMHIILKQMFTFVWKNFFSQKSPILFTDWKQSQMQFNSWNIDF